MKYLYIHSAGKLTLIGRAMSYRTIPEGEHIIVFWSESSDNVEMHTDKCENSMWLSPQSDLLVLDHPM